MTELEMMKSLEEVRKHNEKFGGTIYAMGNGKIIVYVTDKSAKKNLEDDGFWTVAIFEKGHRVEA